MLATLEWPPYSSPELPGGGASVVVARKAFAAVGMELEVRFYPWKRAVDTGLRAEGYMGYMPEYAAQRLGSVCELSQRMGDSPLGLVEHEGHPLVWDSVEDLSKYTLGVVAGYVNTEEFDRLMNEGKLDVRPVADDVTNIRKVSGGRIQGAVMDRNVFRYLMAEDSHVRGMEGEVRFNERLLEGKGLYVCFRKDDKGKRLRDLFNEGLSTFDAKLVQDEYIDKVFSR